MLGTEGVLPNREGDDAATYPLIPRDYLCKRGVMFLGKKPALDVFQVQALLFRSSNLSTLSSNLSTPSQGTQIALQLLRIGRRVWIPWTVLLYWHSGLPQGPKGLEGRPRVRSEAP